MKTIQSIVSLAFKYNFKWIVSKTKINSIAYSQEFQYTDIQLYDSVWCDCNENMSLLFFIEIFVELCHNLSYNSVIWWLSGRNFGHLSDTCHPEMRAIHTANRSLSKHFRYEITFLCRIHEWEFYCVCLMGCCCFYFHWNRILIILHTDSKQMKMWIDACSIREQYYRKRFNSIEIQYSIHFPLVVIFVQMFKWKCVC